MVKTKRAGHRKRGIEGGGFLAVIALILSVISFVLWAIYIPFTFLDIASIICLAMVLPVCVFLIIMGLVLSIIALNIGPGKRRGTAVIAMIFCILQVFLWVGWIILAMMWSTSYFD
jgi:hypothetical protein